MNFLKKAITFMDNIQEGEDLSLRQQITLALWGLTIILLPFFRFPYGVFPHLSFYPIIAIALINADRLWKLCGENKYLRFTGLAIVAYILWQIISLPLTIGQTTITCGANVWLTLGDDIMTFGLWYIFLASSFFFPQEKIRKTFYWSFTITLLYCSLYSFIEILHWSKVQWATDYLARAIYFIHRDVEQNHGWWPPLFWDSPRLRSVFAEPSYFTVLLSFSILYYGFCTWSADRWYKNIGNLFLLMLSGILLCGTKSASASLALSSATVIFIVLFVVFFRKLSLPSKYKGIVLTLLLILFSGTVILNQRGGIDDLQKLSEEITSNKQAKEDFTSSTGTRLIHLQSELKLIAQRPFIGYGTGSYGPAMKEALKNNQEKTYETRLWSETEEYTPPPLNIYTRITVQNGLIGLIFFFLILAPVLVCWGKSYKKIKIEHWISLTLLCCIIAVIFCSVAVNLLYYLCLLVFPFYCFADMVFSEKNKP